MESNFEDTIKINLRISRKIVPFWSIRILECATRRTNLKVVLLTLLSCCLLMKLQQIPANNTLPILLGFRAVFFPVSYTFLSVVSFVDPGWVFQEAVTFIMEKGSAHSSRFVQILTATFGTARHCTWFTTHMNHSQHFSLGE